MRLQRSSGLVGHWKFDEKSGLILNDSSRYKNTGTITQGAGKWTDKGYYFDGTATYVDAGNDNSLKITGAITMSTWIKVYVFPTTTSSTWQTILTKGRSYNTLPNIQYFMGLYNVGGVQKFIAIYNSDGIAGNSLALDSPDSSITNTYTWYHISATWNGTTDVNSNKIYVNGVLKGTSQSIVPTGTDKNLTFRIGRSSFTDLYYFNGIINDVRIYNRALSAGEIEKLYEATKHNYI